MNPPNKQSLLDQALGAPPQKASNLLDQALGPAPQAAPTAPTPATPAAPSAPLDYSARFRHGLATPLYGLGQDAMHLPVFSQLVSGIRSPMHAIGTLDTEALKKLGASQQTINLVHGWTEMFDPVSADQFDNIVKQREQTYQAARQAAGQTGIDWWNLGGQAAPLAVAGLAGGAETAMGRIWMGAAQGGITAAGTPLQVSPGEYWYHKFLQTAADIASGGGLAGLTEAVAPVLRGGVKVARTLLGANAKNSDAADTIVSGALNSKGIDPATINTNVVKAYKQQVQHALDTGASAADISPQTTANLMQAHSLPVPLRLTLGMASRNREQFLAEQRMMDTAGIGQPLAERMKELNDSAIQNLNMLGAGTPTNPVSTGQKLAETVQNYWDQVQAHKTALYDAVKNSKGQAATLDGASTAQQAMENLKAPQAMGAWETLQKNNPGIVKTLENLGEGKLPLTVSTWQALDKSLGQDAAAAEGSGAHIINTIREMLANALIADDAGVEARQAYQLAKQAHAQQMSLVTPKLLNGKANPNFQPLVKDVVIDGKPVENLFKNHFLTPAASVSKKSLDFLSTIDPSVKPLISNTLMGEIKRTALNNASDDVGNLSLSTLKGWARDPVAQAKMEALMPDSAVKTFRALTDQWENVKTVPGGINLGNPSGSGQAAINAVINAAKVGMKGAGKLPGIHSVITNAIVGTAKETRQAAEISRALTPPVTLNSLLSPSGKGAVAQRFITSAAIPGLISAAHGNNKKPNPPEQ